MTRRRRTRSSARKVPYAWREQARAAMLRVVRETGTRFTRLHVYRCADHWHFGHWRAVR